MISYAGENLFASGPAQLHVGGLHQRLQTASSPGADGESIASLGRSGRVIGQRGTLIADTATDLTALTRAIEDLMDGRGHELVDHDGRLFAEVVIVRFEPEAARRLGPRWAVDYAIEYVQPQPEANPS